MANIALVYDADYTLMDGYHPSVVLDRRGLNKQDFWGKVTRTQAREKEKGENTSLDIIYLAHFMNEIRYGQLERLTIRELEEAAADVTQMLYPGLPDFFPAINDAHPYSRISHNIVSVGIKHIIQSSVLGPHLDRVYGYTFFDDLTDNDYIDEIRSTTSSQEKVPAIISISYGSDKTDGYDFPISNLIYFGDGQTDRPAFRFVKKRGGLAICVYNAESEQSRSKAEKMKDDVHFILPADYRKDSQIWNIVNNFIGSREPLSNPKRE